MRRDVVFNEVDFGELHKSVQKEPSMVKYLHLQSNKRFRGNVRNKDSVRKKGNARR